MNTVNYKVGDDVSHGIGGDRITTVKLFVLPSGLLLQTAVPNTPKK